MPRTDLFACRAGFLVVAVVSVELACGFDALAQTRRDEADNQQPKVGGAAGTRVNRSGFDDVAPGQLRPLGDLRITGGGLRPVAGDIRPVGGEIRPVAGDIRPIEIGSPLQNDASFNSRLRAHTPAFGITGNSIEPGWDDVPFGSPSGPLSSFSSSSFGSVSAPARADVGRAVGRVSTAGAVQAPREASGVRGSFAPAASARAAGKTSQTGGQTGGLQSPFFARSSSAWDTPAPQPARTALGIVRNDVRPDVRMAARLTLQERYADAIATIRHGVYQDPEAFSGAQALFAGDADAQQKLRQALAVYQSPGDRFMTEADARFMSAAMSAALGEGDAAFAAISAARESGESRPSGITLYRVLSRGRDGENNKVRP